MLYYNKIKSKCVSFGGSKIDTTNDELYKSILEDNCSELIIPDGTTFIRNNCFQGCESLISVIIPFSIISIGNDCFKDCNNLLNIYIDKDEDSISGAPWGANNAIIHWNKK